MPTKLELGDVVRQLRLAPTRLVPLDIAERVQHTIVKLEAILLGTFPIPANVDVILGEAKELLDYCDSLVRKSQ